MNGRRWPGGGSLHVAGSLLPAKVNHTMPHICIHFELFKQLGRGREKEGKGDGSYPLTRQFCEINLRLASGLRSRCNLPASVHVSHLGQRQTSACCRSPPSLLPPLAVPYQRIGGCWRCGVGINLKQLARRWGHTDNGGDCRCVVASWAN